MSTPLGQGGLPRGLDFIPLEIFLDHGSQARDYDRIVAKTDVAISIDKFNNLRMARGLEWPKEQYEGKEITHLRLHQVSPYTILLNPGSHNCHRTSPGRSRC
jgi:hypothetical protein